MGRIQEEVFRLLGNDAEAGKHVEPDHAFKCYGEDKGKLDCYKKISKWSQSF